MNIHVLNQYAHAYSSIHIRNYQVILKFNLPCHIGIYIYK